MPVTRDTVRVEGLRELNLAFREADTRLAKSFRDSLREGAEPVQRDAQTLAIGTITHIGPHWSRMRIGVTATGVYVAPKMRGRRGQTQKRRPNLAQKLLDSMIPALERNQNEIVLHVDRLLARMAAEWGRGG